MRTGAVADEPPLVVKFAWPEVFAFGAAPVVVGGVVREAGGAAAASGQTWRSCRRRSAKPWSMLRRSFTVAAARFGSCAWICGGQVTLRGTEGVRAGFDPNPIRRCAQSARLSKTRSRTHALRERARVWPRLTPFPDWTTDSRTCGRFCEALWRTRTVEAGETRLYAQGRTTRKRRRREHRVPLHCGGHRA
jgi:hypothetical protein